MKKLIGSILFISFLGFIGLTVWVFSAPNTSRAELYVKTGDNIDSVMLNIIRSNGIKNEWSFQWVQSFMDIVKIYPGKYLITEGMSNRELVNMIKYGRQIEVKIRFGNNVFPYEVYSALGKKYEADSAAFAKAVNNIEKLQALALDTNSSIAIFWADTYQFPWTILPDKVVDFFITDQQKFWDEVRFGKLSQTGLHSSKEAYILASIIEKEAMKAEELPIIAGVYINRLRINMPLQADPTVKYAGGIKLMQRVSGKILETESPYNTYKNTGLPPGPVGLATKKGVDAVLNFQKHDHIYFCAKEDFSGTHYFTKSYKEHQKNAAKYRKALDGRGIR